jgi:hypothetical protein
VTIGSLIALADGYQDFFKESANRRMQDASMRFQTWIVQQLKQLTDHSTSPALEP